jgi:hypothetical protein
MLISPIRNGRRVRPTFGHKRDGGSRAGVLDLFSPMVARLVNGSSSRCDPGRQCTCNGCDRSLRITRFKGEWSDQSGGKTTGGVIVWAAGFQETMEGSALGSSS